MTVIFDGHTAKTRLGWVDMVPLNRRIQGDKKAPVNDSEKDAAVLALHALGLSLVEIQGLMNISWETATDIISGKRAPRPLATQSREDKNDRHRALVLRRRAERVLIDGRMVHPDCMHGANASYTNFGCECELCTEAHRVKRREYRARKAAS